MKFILLLVSTLFLISPAIAQQAKPELCPKPMMLIYYGQWFPYFFKEEGQYKGIDYEFLLSITKQLGCQVKIIPLPEKRIPIELAKGRPLMMVGATYTKERAKYAHYSDPYRQEVMSLLFHTPTNTQKTKQTAADIINNSQAIAINDAAYYGPIIEDYRKSQHSNKFIDIPKLETRMKMLARKRVQAVVGDYSAGCHSFYKNKSNKNQLHNIRVSQTSIAIMLNKTAFSQNFVEQFNKALHLQLDKGIIKRLQQKYTPIDCDQHLTSAQSVSLIPITPAKTTNVATK